MSDDLVSRLRDEAMRLSGQSIDRGCVDSGIGSNLADAAADALTEARAEIERLRQEGLVKDSAIIEAAKLAKKLMTRAVQAEQEHTDMMWQRRRAEERAEEAESALAELTPVKDMLTLCGELGGMGTNEAPADYLRRLIDGLIVGRSALERIAARRFIASQEPAEQEK